MATPRTDLQTDLKADLQPDLQPDLRADPCNLCPRLCGADRDAGGRGACGASGDVLVARAALHYWEEPPISGTAGSGTVFFAHCPLQCVYCQNAAIAMGGAGRAVDVRRLADVFLDLQSQGALNVNCVTPTHYAPQIRDAVALARERGGDDGSAQLAIPVVWNTSGYERVEAIRALSGTVDVYLTDYKYADRELAARYSKAPDYPQVALDAIGAMVDCAGLPRFDEVDGQPRMTGGVVVRHLLLPGALGPSKRAIGMLFDRFGDDVLYSIMNQYTPIMTDAQLQRFPELADRVPDDCYEELLDYADSIGMQDYFWQQGPAAEESFIPAWDFR